MILCFQLDLKGVGIVSGGLLPGNMKCLFILADVDVTLVWRVGGCFYLSRSVSLRCQDRASPAGSLSVLRKNILRQLSGTGSLSSLSHLDKYKSSITHMKSH